MYPCELFIKMEASEIGLYKLNLACLTSCCLIFSEQFRHISMLGGPKPYVFDFYFKALTVPIQYFSVLAKTSLYSQIIFSSNFAIEPRRGKDVSLTQKSK